MPPTREEIVEAARKAAVENGGFLSRSDFQRITGIGQYHVYRLFPEGGWSEVLQLAGVAFHPQYNQNVSDDDLIKEFHRVASELGEIPTWPTLEAKGGFNRKTMTKRFGGARGTVQRYAQWLRANDPTNPLLALAEASLSRPIEVAAVSVGQVTQRGHWDRSDGPEDGAPINFRGLRHAPLNEQGVVYIFGMVSHELGFLVEAVHSAYPDCEAKGVER